MAGRKIIMAIIKIAARILTRKIFNREAGLVNKKLNELFCFSLPKMAVPRKAALIKKIKPGPPRPVNTPDIYQALNSIVSIVLFVSLAFSMIGSGLCIK